MKDILQTAFGLLGGLGLFIFGMNRMSDSLQKVAGERMKKILSVLTRNPLMGVLAGALTTAVLQSSSATIAVLQNFASQPAAALKLVCMEILNYGKSIDKILAGVTEISVLCIDRMGNSCVNIAEVVCDKVNFNYFIS